jgi:hypothetical protein
MNLESFEICLLSEILRLSQVTVCHPCQFNSTNPHRMSNNPKSNTVRLIFAASCNYPKIKKGFIQDRCLAEPAGPR